MNDRAEQTKVALITGAYRGLGLETARQLGRKGYRVILTARKPAAGKKAVAELEKSGSNADFVELDVTDEKSIRSAVGDVARMYGKIDVLINNAAVVGQESGSIVQASENEILDVFKTNVIGPLRVTQAFLPLLLKSKSPRVVNVSSSAGALSFPQGWAPAYSLSKTALNAVTNQLASALKGKVAVNSVCPGWVRTEMGGMSAPRSVEEGASGIVWLASEAPDKLTGGFFRDRKRIEW